MGLSVKIWVPVGGLFKIKHSVYPSKYPHSEFTLYSSTDSADEESSDEINTNFAIPKTSPKFSPIDDSHVYVPINNALYGVGEKEQRMRVQVEYCSTLLVDVLDLDRIR